MPKDRDQLTPDESADRPRIRPHRSADREAAATDDRPTGPGPGSHGSDPRAVDEVDREESDHYR